MFKNKILFLVLVTTLVVVNTYATATSGQEEDIDVAIKTLKGSNTKMSVSQALLYLKSIDDTTNVRVANALGVAYSSALGVQRDISQAAFYFQRAAGNGYLPAYRNLGMLFKNTGSRETQDLKRACAYFKAGAEKGYLPCFYYYGFMLYKGLGCQQNYAAALELFNKAAEKKHAPSLYMLGLCYRNGYGTSQNFDMSKKYLLSAAHLGFQPAVDEIKNRYPENSGINIDSIAISYQEGMPILEPGMNSVSSYIGNHKGIIVTYDWSGKYIISQKPFCIDLQSIKDSIKGYITLGDDKINISGIFDSSGILRFADNNIMLYDRYLGKEKAKYCIESASLTDIGNKLCGNLSLYSYALMEPEKPMYFEIFKDNDGVAISDDKSSISVSPNPFDNEIAISFKSQVSNAKAYVNIHDQSGIVVAQQVVAGIEKGENRVIMQPNIRSGAYVLSVQIGNNIFRTIILKK